MFWLGWGVKNRFLFECKIDDILEFDSKNEDEQ